MGKRNKRAGGALARSGRHRPRVRRVEIDGLGTVTMHGLSAAALGELKAEAEAGGQELHMGLSDAEAREHPFTALLVMRQSEPRLTAEQFAGLSDADCERLTAAVMEAHPETRRLYRGAQAEEEK